MERSHDQQVVMSEQKRKLQIACNNTSGGHIFAKADGYYKCSRCGYVLYKTLLN